MSRNPLGLIHEEVYHRLGHVTWTDGYPATEKRPHPLPASWPRCCPCDLADSRSIIPAYAVTRDGIPVCLAHLSLGGMPYEELLPPCALCGEPCTWDRYEWDDPRPLAWSSDQHIPVEGYVCTAHADQGKATPASRGVWQPPFVFDETQRLLHEVVALRSREWFNRGQVADQPTDTLKQLCSILASEAETPAPPEHKEQVSL